MARFIRFGLLAVAFMALSGCASERLFDTSMPTPGWAQQPPEPTDDALLFVGQALGDNILDERGMRERAMEDARQQMAARIASDIRAQTAGYVLEKGYAPAGENEVEQAEYVSQVATKMHQELHGVRQEAAYWEKWRVDPGFFGRSFVRYKYRVLAAYPREQYERKLHKYVRLVEDQRRARELINAGQPRQAARLLSDLIDDYPDAPVSAWLILADAYETAGMLRQAEDVLRSALDIAAEGEEVRVRQRLEQVETALPHFPDIAVYLIADVASTVEAGRGVPGWVDAPLVSARLRIAAHRTGDADGPLAPYFAAAERMDARWLVTIGAQEAESRAPGDIYGISIERACVECTVRFYETEDGTMAAGAAVVECVSGRSHAGALNSAARTATLKAVRECLLTIAETPSSTE